MDVEKMADAVFKNVSAFVVKALEPLSGRLDAVEQSVKDLPGPIQPAPAEEVATLLLPALLEAARREIADLPPAKPGIDGKSVNADEVAVLFERRFSDLALHWERQANDLFQRAIDKMPKPKDGVDALGFDDMTVEHDGERDFTLRFVRGDQVKEFAFCVPLVIDRGFWAEGKTAELGDGMTFGGSYWIAQKATDTKPEIGNPDWRLAVKKGRDGKDFTK